MGESYQNRLFESLIDSLKAGEYEGINSLLEKLDVENTQVRDLRVYLQATLPYAKHLPSRSSFHERVVEKARDCREYEENYFKALR